MCCHNDSRVGMVVDVLPWLLMCYHGYSDWWREVEDKRPADGLPVSRVSVTSRFCK